MFFFTSTHKMIVVQSQLVYCSNQNIFKVSVWQGKNTNGPATSPKSAKLKLKLKQKLKLNRKFKTKKTNCCRQQQRSAFHFTESFFVDSNCNEIWLKRLSIEWLMFCYYTLIFQFLHKIIENQWMNSRQSVYRRINIAPKWKVAKHYMYLCKVN
jgi:hypothetical protein